MPCYIKFCEQNKDIIIINDNVANSSVLIST